VGSALASQEPVPKVKPEESSEESWEESSDEKHKKDKGSEKVICSLCICIIDSS
jgi:hypothetical protein